LRERPQDIKLLAEYFLDDFCARNNFKHKTLDDSVYPVLESHTWPGNARELRNAIERMAILTAGERLTRDAIPVEIRLQRDPGPRSSVQEARESRSGIIFCGRWRKPIGTCRARRGRWGWSGRICISGFGRWGEQGWSGASGVMNRVAAPFR